jgi:hypothetical protein
MLEGAEVARGQRICEWLLPNLTLQCPFPAGAKADSAAVVVSSEGR